MDDEDRDIDIESDGDKKAHHNALERKRRDHIKDSFTGLRDCVPALHGEKASRAQILKKAAEYIHHMRKKNNVHQHDIEDLKKQNNLLEGQIKSLEKNRNVDDHYGCNYNSDSAAAVITNAKGAAISAFDGGSDTESSDSEKQTRHNSTSSSSSSTAANKTQHIVPGGTSRRKKLKTSNHSNGS